jgi:hypothetical protein
MGCVHESWAVHYLRQEWSYVPHHTYKLLHHPKS